MDPNIKTYIGKRGYVLIKKHFSADFLDNLKKQLTVKPNTNDDYGAPAEEFPVFTENKNKLYIPKFFGFNNPQLGKPQLNRVPHGQDIDAKFNGKLRPHQVEPVNVALKSCQEKGGGILALPCAFGKCMGKGTPIIMYNGSIKMVEDVKVGDLLMGDDSKPRKVLSLARGQDEMYKIKQNNGNDFVVNQEHILCLKSSPKYCSINGYKMNKGDIIEISVKDYLNLPKSYVYSRGRPLRCYKVGVNFPEKEVDLDPYMLGYWLGDGSKSKPLISTQESKVLIYFREKIKEMGLYFDYYKGSYDYQITSGRKYYDKNSFLKSLQNYNLLYNKHVPDEYKYNSRDIRLKVLAGLIDSDGYFIKGVYDFTLKDERLIDDIIYLGRSLGFVCSNKRSCQKTCTNAKNGPKTGTYFKTSIFGYGLEEIPVLCTRKKASKRQLIKNPLLSGFEVEHIGRGDYYGFTLDGNGRYLLEDFTVTHNTSLSLYILSQLGKKALVIVHKEFLLNQWKERIEQFLPEARIGIIQQDKVDIDNKDIVIAMLQSISMKEYAMDTFDSMGTVVIDECMVRTAPIITDKGHKSIFKLYNDWNSNKELPLIRSFNEVTNQFEYKKLTYAWEKEYDGKFIELHLGDRKIKCTSGHKILTRYGYVEAEKLQIGDLIVSSYDSSVNGSITRVLNSDQKQIIYGSFLGDGSVSKSKYNRYFLRIVHGKKQKNYCEWKANMFNAKLDYVKENGFSKKEAYRFKTKIFDLKGDLPNNKSTCPQWLIDELDERGLAIWIMDDGSFNKNIITLSTCSFDLDTNNRLIKKLSDMGIESHLTNYYKKDRDRSYYSIKILKKGFKILVKKIINYMHEDLLYKIGIDKFNKYQDDLNKDKDDIFNDKYNIPIDKREIGHIYKCKHYQGIVREYLWKECDKCQKNTFHGIKRKKYNNWLCLSCIRKTEIDENIYSGIKIEEYNWNYKFEEYGYSKINNIIKSIEKCKVYDIEVEDNHNFIVAGLKYNQNSKENLNGIVAHNCHHISSKVFSRALRKINSQYMIGLSATPNRKDGLTKVFKWYIGDVIYHKKHEDVNTVHVERLIIKSDNEYYNKECINFRGKVMMPKMINNICENMNRTRVIIHWVKELLEEDRKIIILSDRRQHLEDMNKLLYESKIKSVGFYVGGMKQKDLDISAQKNIILGTFAIASEGLDIPGLDTIFLTSPKSDVVQAIGRILRKKHEELIPKIIDIVDTFSLFETQANKRNRLYRQRKYIINDIIVWDMLDANGEPQIESNIQQKYNNKSQNLNDEKTFKKQFSNNFMFSTTSTPVKENNKPLSQSKISDFHS